MCEYDSSSSQDRHHFSIFTWSGKQVATKTRITANVSHNRLHWKNGIPHALQIETRKETSLVTTEADVQDAKSTKESSVATEVVIPREKKEHVL